MQNHPEDLKPFQHKAQNRCFGCGPDHPSGLRLEFQIASDGSVVCLTTVAQEFDAWKGFLHGGIIATLLDEAMSKAVRAHGVTAMTRRLEVEFLRPVPSQAPIRIEGQVTLSDGRKHETRARILNDMEQILARGTGLFIDVGTLAPSGATDGKL